MTTAQQVAYWKHYARKHEQTAKDRGDYDDLKSKADQFDQLQAESQTENEKKVTQAKIDGRNEMLAPLVNAEFRAAAAGRLEPDRLTAILEPLDMSKFLTSKGEVDQAKVKQFIDGVAPATGGGKGGGPDMGQGRQGGGTKLTGAEAGRAEALKRFGKPAGQQ
jgi:alanyl-tRNA synthetase